MDAARVDVAALLSVARQYQAVADSIDAAVRTYVARMAFDGAGAGRAYIGHGDALRTGIDDIGNRLQQWSRASAEVAATLRASTQRYTAADSSASRRLGDHG